MDNYKTTGIAICCLLTVLPQFLGAIGRGAAAPSFCLTNINSPDDKPPAGRICLKNLVGPKTKGAKKAVLLSFFATWCIPCKNELPFLEQLKKNYNNQGLEIIVVNIEQENEPGLKDLLKELSISMVVIKDVYQILMQRYGVKELPSLFLIDRKGSVADHFSGFDEEAKKSIEQAILEIIK